MTMTVPAKHLALGAAGEEAAARYLESRGWRVIARNWRPEGAFHGLELDIVAGQGGCLVFVEVKTRRMVTSGNGEKEGIPVYAAFSRGKREKMLRAARCYLAARALWELPCRFDLICVTRTPQGELLLEHHDNVIEFGHPVDSRHTPWQPW